jgi:glutaredoxin 3
MARVTIYSTGTCPVCDRAKAFMNKKNIDFDEVRIDLGRDRMREFLDKTNGARTVPQILIDDKLVGGFSELTEADMDGELDDLKRSSV